MMRHIHKHLPLKTLMGAAAIAVFISLIFLTSMVHSQSGSTPITGWAWGGDDTDSNSVADAGVGWISLNCSTGGPTTNNPSVNICGSGSYQVTYGLSADASGNVTGYAWSDNIGWISAYPTDVGSCGTSPKITGTNFSGWLKAYGNGGGWDGCISLSGVSPAYGVITPSNNSSYNPVVSGAWGGGQPVIGWLAFDASGGQCIPVYSCSGNTSVNSCTGSTTDCGVVGCDGGTGQCNIGPSQNGCISLNTDVRAPSNCNVADKSILVRKGVNVTVYWNSQGLDTCNVSGGGTGSGLSGQLTISNVQSKVTVNLSCSGSSGSFTDSAVINFSPKFIEK